MSVILPVSPARRRRSMAALIAVLALLAALFSVAGQASSARADGGTATVSGTVTDASTSAPLAGVLVDINSQDSSYFDVAVTRADGTYTLSAVPAGSYTLQFEPDNGANYVQQCWQGDSCDDGNQTYFTVADAQVLTGYDAALAPGATITGTVTDGSGNPVANVNVDVSTPDGSGNGGATTDADGDYSITALPAGQYQVDFDPSAGNYLEQWWNNQPTAASANLVSLTAGSTASAINAQLAAGATISGTVSTAAGPLAGATVAALNTANDQITAQEPTTDANGDYTIAGLPAGVYKVVFDAPQDQNFATQWWNDVSTYAAATPITAAVSTPVTGINATLVTGATISGTIFAPGSPKVGLANAVVNIYSASGGSSIAGSATNAKGRYKIDDLPAGDYSIQVTTGYQSGAVASEWWGGTFIQTGAQVLTLTQGQAATGINQQLIVGSPISGTVMEGGVPAVDVEVDVWDSDSTVTNYTNYPFETNTDSSGNYTLPNMGPGKYTIDFQSLDPHFSGQWWNNKPTQAKANKLTVVKDVAVAGIDATLAPVVITPGRPTVTGQPRVGRTLTAHHGTWKPKGMTFTYQWLSDGQPIPGATSTTYVPTAADLGDAISVAITGTTVAYQSQGISQTVTSADTALIKPAR